MVKDKQIDASKATIIIYGEGQDINAGIYRLEHLLEEDYHIKEFKDDIITKLSKTHVCNTLINIIQMLLRIKDNDVH